jgi:hypothetical protein
MVYRVTRRYNSRYQWWQTIRKTDRKQGERGGDNVAGCVYRGGEGKTVQFGMYNGCIGLENGRGTMRGAIGVWATAEWAIK